MLCLTSKSTPNSKTNIDKIIVVLNEVNRIRKIEDCTYETIVTPTSTAGIDIKMHFT